MSPQIGHSLVGANERDNLLALPAAVALVHAARDAVSACCQGSWPALLSLLTTQTPALLPSQSVPSLSAVKGFLLGAGLCICPC